jgi:hypothetical protein
VRISRAPPRPLAARTTAKHDEPVATDRSEIESLRERVHSGQSGAKDLFLVDRLLGLVDARVTYRFL